MNNEGLATKVFNFVYKTKNKIKRTMNIIKDIGEMGINERIILIRTEFIR